MTRPFVGPVRSSAKILHRPGGFALPYADGRRTATAPRRQMQPAEGPAAADAVARARQWHPGAEELIVWTPSNQVPVRSAGGLFRGRRSDGS